MAGDSKVNNPQKVQCKLKVKPKVRETKALLKANESKEISKVKITKEIPKLRETKALAKANESKEISKVKITKEIPKLRETKTIPKVKESNRNL